MEGGGEGAGRLEGGGGPRWGSHQAAEVGGSTQRVRLHIEGRTVDVWVGGGDGHWYRWRWREVFVDVGGDVGWGGDGEQLTSREGRGSGGSSGR